MDPTVHMQWIGDADAGYLRLLDQTHLPQEQVWLECRSVEDIFDAIRRLAVRGAPAIGIAAAYGCILAVQGTGGGGGEGGDAPERLQGAAERLAESRPTAVNLFWALKRMRRVRPVTAQALLDEARAIHSEDADMCRRIGEHGLRLIEQVAANRAGRPVRILTHCNAGALATGGIGTATAPMYLAHQRGMAIEVFADETRPLLQGARLTAWELAAAGLDVTVVCDGMAAMLMRAGRVDMVITGTDRVAANGDVANKIGTYALAVAARHHDVPFFVAAPRSTFDLDTAGGEHIPIEHRDDREVTHLGDRRIVPAGARVYNPAFDVTPAALVSALLTDAGPIQPVNASTIARTLQGASTPADVPGPA